MNSDGKEDKSEFDVAFVGTESGKRELSHLFETFCKENGFKSDTVINVIVVRSADTEAELDGDSYEVNNR